MNLFTPITSLETATLQTITASAIAEMAYHASTAALEHNRMPCAVDYNTAEYWDGARVVEDDGQSEKERYDIVTRWATDLAVDSNKVYDLSLSYVSYDSHSSYDRTFEQHPLLTGNEVLDMIASNSDGDYAYGYNFSVTEVTIGELQKRIDRLTLLRDMVA